MICIFHKWGWLIPFMDKVTIDGKEYFASNGYKCIKCGKYKLGTMFFPRGSGPVMVQMRNGVKEYGME